MGEKVSTSAGNGQPTGQRAGLEAEAESKACTVQSRDKISEVLSPTLAMDAKAGQRVYVTDTWADRQARFALFVVCTDRFSSPYSRLMAHRCASVLAGGKGSDCSTVELERADEDAELRQTEGVSKHILVSRATKGVNGETASMLSTLLPTASGSWGTDDDRARLLLLEMGNSRDPATRSRILDNWTGQDSWVDESKCPSCEYPQLCSRLEPMDVWGQSTMVH